MSSYKLTHIKPKRDCISKYLFQAALTYSGGIQSISNWAAGDNRVASCNATFLDWRISSSEFGSNLNLNSLDFRGSTIIFSRNGDSDKIYVASSTSVSDPQNPLNSTTFSRLYFISLSLLFNSKTCCISGFNIYLNCQQKQIHSLEMNLIIDHNYSFVSKFKKK